MWFERLAKEHKLCSKIYEYATELVNGQPEIWDQYLPAALFAYHEVPQGSSGSAAFKNMDLWKY